MRSYISKKFALVIASLYALMVVAAPVSVFAANDPNANTVATNSNAIPRSFASKEACTTALQGRTIEEIKAYGATRIDTRLKKIDNLDKKIDKYFGNTSSADKAIATANANSDAFLKKVGLSPLDEKETTKNSEKILRADVAHTKKIVTKAKTALDAGSSPSDAADAVCDAVWDSRVYSFLGNKISYYKQVDLLYNANAKNVIYYQTVQKLIKADKIKDSDVKFSKVPDPLETKAKIAKMEALVIGVKNNDDFKAAKFEAIAKKYDYKTLKGEAIANRKPIYASYRDAKQTIREQIAAAKRAAAAKARQEAAARAAASSSSGGGSSSSGGGSSGGVSSGGGSAPSGGGGSAPSGGGGAGHSNHATRQKRRTHRATGHSAIQGDSHGDTPSSPAKHCTVSGSGATTTCTVR